MDTKKMISPFFWIAGLYDGILGLAFLLLGMQIFEYYQITPPNHIGYIQFPGALLIVFALMFFAVAKNPVKNRNLIIYGILLKVSYCTVVFYHWFTTGIPWIWKPFAIFDILFLILFIFAQKVLNKEK